MMMMMVMMITMTQVLVIRWLNTGPIQSGGKVSAGTVHTVHPLNRHPSGHRKLRRWLQDFVVALKISSSGAEVLGSHCCLEHPSTQLLPKA